MKKLPFDRQYMKVVFHIVVTMILVYMAYLIMHYFDKIVITLGQIIKITITVLAPLVIAFVLAYLLDPVVEFFQRKFEVYRGKAEIQHPRKRLFGTSLVYIIIIGILGGLLYMGISGLIITLNNAGSAPKLIDDYIKSFSGLFNGMQDFFDKIGIWSYIAPAIQGFIKGITTFAADLGNILISFFSAAGAITMNIAIALIIGFYLLNEKEFAKAKIKEIILAFLSKKNTSKVNNIAGDIDAVFSGYIRGQMTDALIMTFLITTALFIIDVRYPVIIGLISGFSNLIPYFGAIIGLFLAVIVTLLEGEYFKALIVIAVILVIQQIDSAFIIPRVVGQSVELHPVIVLVAITAAGQLFGLVGMIFAVPVVATIKLFLSRYLERQKAAKRQIE